MPVGARTERKLSRLEQVLEPTYSVTASFSNARAAICDATWGQRALWQSIRLQGEGPNPFIVGDRIRVPSDCSLETTIDSLTDVVTRCDSLRTTYAEVDGSLKQIVAAEGSFSVDVYGVQRENADATAFELLRRAKSEHTFDIANNLPICCAVVTAEGQPTCLVLVVGHIAVDGFAWGLLVDRLEAALSGSPRREELVVWQPTDQAKWEKSYVGQRANERSIQYWRRILQSAPASMFDFPRRLVEDVRYRELLMESPALSHATTTLARQWQVSTGSLFLAATATILGLSTGHSEVIVHVNSANRGSPERRNLVSTLTQLGIVLADLERDTFYDIARRTFAQSLSAYVAALYDPTALQMLGDELELRRGSYLGIGAMFNDSRLGAQGTAESPPEVELTADRLSRTARQTIVSEVGRHERRVDAIFNLNVIGNGKLLFTGDTSYFSPSDMHRMLGAIEQLLLLSCTRDVPTDHVVDLTGVPLVSRPVGWVGDLPESAVADEDGGEVGEGLEMLGFAFVAAGQTAVVHQPGQGCLDDPAVPA